MVNEMFSKMLSEKDAQIIAALRDNARQSLTEISKKTGIPITTVYERIKSYEGDLIKKHTCLLDFNKFSFGIRAFIALKANKGQREELRRQLEEDRCINSIYQVNSGYDFMIEGIFEDVKAMQHFIEDLEKKFGIQVKNTYHILEDIMREAFLANQNRLKGGN